MMQSGEAGEKISNIELVDLTPEDAKKRDANGFADGRQSLPDT
jgi:hypothetical protein